MINSGLALVRSDHIRKRGSGSAFQALQERVSDLRRRELAADLLPLFESRLFSKARLDAFPEIFAVLVWRYL